ncbi:MAG: glycosyltransferase [Acidimicrobiales bacterium]|nr:glycosyltransferase [Acidimicrobiales bacterium]
MRRRRGSGPTDTGPISRDGPARVLIISASMGAGHDGAARNLAEQLRAAGHHAEVKDFLDSGPLRIGVALRRGYEFELKHVPSAYDATYRLWYRAPWLCPLITWIVTFLTGRRVRRWVEDLAPRVVVSTYPLSTLCLGRLRAKRRLGIPAVNFITDFGVHPLWVHRGIDLNLAVHDLPADIARRRSGRPTIACGPAVSSRFDQGSLSDRIAARSQLGLGPNDKAVLIVAGSWGVGNLEETWRAVAGDGRFVPVVVCGKDERLYRHVVDLASSPAGERPASASRVLGWTDDMPSLMAACDALVENAGGLTSLEAMRAGLPVVSFDPIAGHGKENTAAMDAAGVARLAPDARSLNAALDQLSSPGPVRAAQIAGAARMFAVEPAELVLSAAALEPLGSAARSRRALVGMRVALGAAALSAVGWAGLTTGVAVATEAGAGVAHPAKGSGAVAFVGVRLNEQELDSPAVTNMLASMRLTAVVDRSTAEEDPGAVRDLAGQGVDVANGGLGDSLIGARSETDAPWTRARGDARAGGEISQLIDAPVTVTVPGRRLNAWDLMACRNAHTSLVVPNHILWPDRLDGEALHVVPRKIYLVNGLNATPQQLTSYLQRLEASLSASGLSAAPLATLA